MAKLNFLGFTPDTALPGGKAGLYHLVRVEKTRYGLGIRPPPWRLGGLRRWPTRPGTVLAYSLKKGKNNHVLENFLNKLNSCE